MRQCLNAFNRCVRNGRVMTTGEVRLQAGTEIADKQVDRFSKERVSESNTVLT